jgi:hypothetical protein
LTVASERLEHNSEPLAVDRVKPRHTFAGHGAIDGRRGDFTLAGELAHYVGSGIADVQFGAIGKQQNGDRNGTRGN